jgi:4,5-dihydroxyphthalate decarboxylase
MANLKLTMACDARQLAPLYDGTVQFEGIDLEIERVVPRERHARMAEDAPWDICEFSTAGCMAGAGGGFPFTAIPVFPLREFRHRGIWVAADSGITEPSQLNGKRIGVQNWDNSAAIWQKGPLAQDHSFDIASVNWFALVPVESPGFQPPSWLKLNQLPRGTKLDRMLLDGELDAIMVPMPMPFAEEDRAKARRLFPNFVQVEQEFYARHSVFPIMHTVVIKHDVLDANSWVATSVFDGIERTLETYVAQQRAANPASPVWPGLDWAAQEKILGPNPWPSGLAANRTTLQTAIDYSVAQGLLAQPIQPEQVFERDGKPLVAAN